MSIKADLLSRLSKIAEQYDPLIDTLRIKNARRRPNWVVSMLVLPIKNFSKIRSMSNLIDSSMQYIYVSLLPILFAVIPFFVLETTSESIIWSIVAFLGGYVITLLFGLANMITLEHHDFHIDAYRIFKRKEYELFESAFLYEDFSFKNLNSFVQESFTIKDILEEKFSRTIEINLKEIIEQFQQEKQNYINESEKLSDMLNRADELAQIYEEELDTYEEDIRRAEKVIRCLIEVLKETNINLYRMKNGCFSWADLKFIAPFTVYKLDNDQLVKIADIGTTGISPMNVSLHDEQYGHYSMVQLARDNKYPVVKTEPHEGRQIVSLRMEMDMGELWIYNFHIDSNMHEKALLLLDSNDIINSNEIFRLIHSLCLLLQKARVEERG